MQTRNFMRLCPFVCPLVCWSVTLKLKAKKICMTLQLLLSECESVWEERWGWGESGGWILLPTHLQQYYDPTWSHHLFFSSLFTISKIFLKMWCLVKFRRSKSIQFCTQNESFCNFFRYFEYPVVTTEEFIEGEPIPFPAVTICAPKPLKRAQIEEFLLHCENLTTDANLKRICLENQHLRPVVQNVDTTYFWNGQFSRMMMQIDEPYTFVKSDNVNLNLLNDVDLLYYSKTTNESRRPFYKRHSHRAQCKEYGFSPHINASQVGNDYSIVNFENVDEINWDDSMFFMIPSGKSYCRDDTPCDDFRYRIAVHSPSHFPRVFQDFWKYSDKLTLVGMDSFIERELLPAPYGNCRRDWPDEARRIAQGKNLSFILRNNYSLNECISSFRTYGVHCPSECDREEYSILKTWTVATMNNLTQEFFNLSVSQNEYAKVEIVFLQLSHRKIKQKEMIPLSQLMGTIGGLAGLCMGISLVSLVEVGELCLCVFVCVIKHFARSNNDKGRGESNT